MDFLNSLSEVAKNRQNFKKWEENQRNQQAQREALYKKHPISQAELQHAKEYGENIIDVVDIMDNHSENIAENVETVTQPLVGIIPAATLLGTGYLSLKKIIKPANKAINKITEEMYLNNDKTKQLIDDINKFNAEANYEKGLNHTKYLSKYELKSKKAMKEIQNPEHRKQAEELLAVYKKKIAPHLKKVKLLSWSIPLAAFLASFVGINIYAAKIQCDSSKIARFQARKILEDPKAFVNYTPEQIKQAKAELAKHPELIKKDRKDKLQGGLIKGLINIIKDKRAYKNALKNDTDDSKKSIKQLSPEELKQAQKDRELIQRTVRVINNEAEVYSQNMEVAANVIIGSTPFLGAGVGLIISAICNATKVFDKKIANLVKKYGSEDAQKAYAEYIKIKPKEAGKNGAWKRFFFEMRDNSHNYSKSGQNATAKVSKSKSILDPMKRLAIPIAATKHGRNAILGIVGGYITAIAGALIGLKLQKSSARAGRYTAKRELEKDPRNFAGYSEEEFKEVENVKTQKPKESQIKKYITFLPTVIKQYWAYNKYKKTEFKERQALKDELHKQDVSNEQLREAKNLQRKIFNTFEKVDDNSQIYSESMEAANQIAQPFVFYGGILLAASPLAYFGIQAARGKYSPKIIIEKITNLLSKGTGVMNKKWFKNYLDDVSKNIPDKIKATNTKYYRADPDKELVTKVIMGSLKNSPTETIGTFKNLIKKYNADFKKLSAEDVKLFMEKLSNNHMSNRTIRSLELETVDKTYLIRVLPKIEKIINDIPDEEITKITKALVKEYEENPERFMAFIQQGNITSALITPKLKKALAAAGVSWFAFNMFMTYAVEQIMADMQLKAGRLGVMKAIESLEDPAYYANIEEKAPPTSQLNQPAQTTQTIQTAQATQAVETQTTQPLPVQTQRKFL